MNSSATKRRFEESPAVGTHAKHPRRPSGFHRDHDLPFPAFRRPQVIGSFTLDADRKFKNDRSGIKFLKLPKAAAGKRISLDLNAGVRDAVRKNEDECKEERLSSLLRWITINGDRFAAPVSTAPPPKTTLVGLNTDFVCYRGLLTQLMCTPYENREGWKVLAVRYRGTVYLHKDETEEARGQRLSTTDRQKTMGSWGYKFEQYMLADTPTGEPDPEPPVIESEEFCCVFRTRIGLGAGHSIVYGGEMDGVEISERLLKASEATNDAIDLNGETFVELKTSRQIEHQGHQRTLLKFKMIKWWCQCFLVGVPKVVCGFRDDDGVVGNLTEFGVSDIPKRCAEHWLPNVCMNYLDSVLAHFMSEMSRVSERKLVSFSWDPKEGGGRIAMREEKRMDLGAMLPEWYINADVFGQ